MTAENDPTGANTVRPSKVRDWLDAVATSDLGRSDRSVAAWIALRFDNRDLAAFPTQATLAAETALHNTNISKSIARLVDKGLLAKHRVGRRVHYEARLPNSPDHSTETSPPSPDFCATVAPLVRSHLWQGKRPPADAPKRWGMARELDIARRLAQDHGEEAVIGAIPHVREVYGLNGRPLTLRVAYQKGHRGRFHECIAAWRKEQASEAPELAGVLRGVDE